MPDRGCGWYHGLGSKAVHRILVAHSDQSTLQKLTVVAETFGAVDQASNTSSVMQGLSTSRYQLLVLQDKLIDLDRIIPSLVGSPSAEAFLVILCEEDIQQAPSQH